MALPLLGAVAAPKRLIADKAYDAESLRRWLKARRVKVVISSTTTRTKPYPSTDRPIGAATRSSACSAASVAHSTGVPGSMPNRTRPAVSKLALCT
jgi:hypothetical protein